ncbi:uncharacterized protein LAESUDRAFT_811198 [Laetiporus sulphureus 93-53]|uniref:Bromo domain-containing protein n=1 Tax=Laetiporus sulphureus 93-53 TaxID=1314785 RepID=A0A165F888_9APHY|nr:uncharacterized protein LAESUDRAFT_811198 [Laetiporus sulphureus 93-53]KZT08577.1 hypothetical protein LAESUDRAFT_811198 [Laetiporus sulphureus 93-53]
MHVANGEAKFRLLSGTPHRQVVESPTPPAPPPVSAVSHKMTAIDLLAPTLSPDSDTTTIERVDHDQSPPAERAWSFSDAEKASMTNAGVPPLISATPEPQPVPPSQAAQQIKATLAKVIEKMSNPNELTSKDLLDNHISENTSSAKGPNDGIFAEQFKFCDRILKKLRKRRLDGVIVSLFHEPSEFVSEQRLCKGEYATPENFRDDFKLMIRNALTLNPPMNPVHEAGKVLDRYFDEKWRDLPPLHSQATSDGEDDFDSEEERQRSIANMEEQILNMKSNLDLLKRNCH